MVIFSHKSTLLDKDMNKSRRRDDFQDLGSSEYAFRDPGLTDPRQQPMQPQGGYQDYPQQRMQPPGEGNMGNTEGIILSKIEIVDAKLDALARRLDMLERSQPMQPQGGYQDYPQQRMQPPGEGNMGNTEGIILSKIEIVDAKLDALARRLDMLERSQPMQPQGGYPPNSPYKGYQRRMW